MLQLRRSAGPALRQRRIPSRRVLRHPAGKGWRSGQHCGPAAGGGSRARPDCLQRRSADGLGAGAGWARWPCCAAGRLRRGLGLWHSLSPLLLCRPVAACKQPKANLLQPHIPRPTVGGSSESKIASGTVSQCHCGSRIDSRWKGVPLPKTLLLSGTMTAGCCRIASCTLGCTFCRPNGGGGGGEGGPCMMQALSAEC